jgi:hypothetical protein
MRYPMLLVVNILLYFSVKEMTDEIQSDYSLHFGIKIKGGTIPLCSADSF